MNEEQIEFNKSRDFSETLNVSFAFIKQNFKPFFKTLLFLVGPVLLLNSILSGLYLKNQFDFNAIIQGTRTATDVLSPVYFLIILFALVANIMLMGIVYEFIMLYEKKGANNFSVKEVWDEFVGDLGLITSTFFFLFGIGILFVVVLGLIGFLLAELGTVGMVLIFIFFLLFFLVLGPPLAFIVSAIYPIRIRERVSNTEALSKAYELTKANFGNTWVIIFVSYIIVMVLTLFLTIPSSIAAVVLAVNAVSDGNATSTIILAVLNTLGTFGGSFINTIILIVIGFHYFSINEKENGDGLLERINQIGENETNNEDITI